MLKAPTYAAKSSSDKKNKSLFTEYMNECGNFLSTSDRKHIYAANALLDSTKFSEKEKDNVKKKLQYFADNLPESAVNNENNQLKIILVGAYKEYLFTKDIASDLKSITFGDGMVPFEKVSDQEMQMISRKWIQTDHDSSKKLAVLNKETAYLKEEKLSIEQETKINTQSQVSETDHDCIKRDMKDIMNRLEKLKQNLNQIQESGQSGASSSAATQLQPTILLQQQPCLLSSQQTATTPLENQPGETAQAEAKAAKKSKKSCTIS